MRGSYKIPFTIPKNLYGMYLKGRSNHVGVVTSVENGMVHTIEGNVDGEVARRVYLLDDPHILGYGELSWK